MPLSYQPVRHQSFELLVTPPHLIQLLIVKSAVSCSCHQYPGSGLITFNQEDCSCNPSDLSPRFSGSFCLQSASVIVQIGAQLISYSLTLKNLQFSISYRWKFRFFYKAFRDLSLSGRSLPFHPQVPIFPFKHHMLSGLLVLPCNWLLCSVLSLLMLLPVPKSPFILWQKAT